MFRDFCVLFGAFVHLVESMLEWSSFHHLLLSDLGQAVAANDGAAQFVKLRNYMDPEGRFMNPFFEEILSGITG